MLRPVPETFRKRQVGRVNDEQRTDEETPDGRFVAALRALASRGYEGFEALLADVLEGRARTDHQLLGDAADRPALLNLVCSRGWTTSPRQRFDTPTPSPVGQPAPKTGPGLGAPAEEWARHLGFTTAEEHPFDQENQP